MKWSWTIGKIAGIRIRMHWTFLLLLAWVAVSYSVEGGGWPAAVKGVVFVLAVFVCIILHETGHALTARRYGVETEDITLLPIGGMARMQRIPSNPRQEFWIAVAGPAVNVVIAAVLFLIVYAERGLGVVAEWPTFAASFLVNLMWVNVILVAFNILPAFPMDGGRVLRALLATRMPYARATETAAGVGQMMAILFGIAGLFYNPLLLFIALFVYLGAEAENQSVQLRDVLGDVPVGAAMMTRYRTLSLGDTLQTAVDELLAGAQQDFPVVDEAGFRGLLRRQDLVEAVRRDGPEAPIDSAVTPVAVENIPDENDLLRDTLELMRKLGYQSLPVFKGGGLAGVITMENVGEYVMIRSATQGKHAKPPAKDIPQAA